MAVVYLLTRGAELLGTLRPDGADFPWVYCTFEPTAAFEEVRELFDEFAAADAEDFGAQDECFARIEALGLRLESEEDSRGPGEFFIVIRGDKASIR